LSAAPNYLLRRVGGWPAGLPLQCIVWTSSGRNGSRAAVRR